MNKNKYIVWLYNGESYDDFQETVLGVFSTEEKAEIAKQKAKEHITQKWEEYKQRWPNNYYPSVSAYGISLNYRNYEISIEKIQENMLRQP